MQIEVKTGDNCCGCGACVETCPEVFHQCRWTGLAEVIANDFTNVESAVVLAAGSCPTCNITVERDGVAVEQEFTVAPVAAVERLCNDVIELVLDTEFSGFSPGQYTTFELKDRRGRFCRAYSIVACEDGRLVFCVKLDPKGRAGRLFARAKAGDKMRITAPKGRFRLLPDEGKRADRPRTFVATGTGIAPILPMLKALPQVPKRVLFGVRHENDVFYTERLVEVPNTTVQVTVSRPESSWQGLRGRVTDHLHTLDLAHDEEVYLCGSMGMVSDVSTALAERGHSPDSIVAESFSMTVSGAPGQVTRSKWQTFGLWARRVHFYASIPVMMLLLFYGITGFLGNRADLFASQIPGDTSEGSGAGDEDGSLSLPADLPLTVAAVVPWLARQYGGHIDPELAEEDEDMILCDAESVWGTHSFTVDKAGRTYEVESRRAPWITALVNLHRGKHGDWRQKIVADIAAFVLILVTLTGAAMVLAVRARPRQRVVLGALGVVSVLLLVLFLLNR